MSDDKKPAPEREAQTRENVRIVGKVVWSINSMTAEQEAGSSGVFTGTVPEALLAENKEFDSSVD